MFSRDDIPIQLVIESAVYFILNSLLVAVMVGAEADILIPAPAVKSPSTVTVLWNVVAPPASAISIQIEPLETCSLFVVVL